MAVEHIPEWQREIAKKWAKKLWDDMLDLEDGKISVLPLHSTILSAIRDAIQQNATGLEDENKRLQQENYNYAERLSVVKENLTVTSDEADHLRGRVEELGDVLSNLYKRTEQMKRKVGDDAYYVGYRDSADTMQRMIESFSPSRAIPTPAVETPADPQSGEGGEALPLELPVSQAQTLGIPKMRTWADYREGCLSTFNAGYKGNEDHLIVFRCGMGTVFNLLEDEFPPLENLRVVTSTENRPASPVDEEQGDSKQPEDKES